MSDWRAAHQNELLEKQRHISQKLAQLREFRKLVKKWRDLVKKYKEWLKSLEEMINNSEGFSVEALTRMGSITAQLSDMIGEFEQMGDAKTMGTGSTTTQDAGTGSMTAQEQAAATSELLHAKAGPLVNMAPWELVWYIDPETSESVKKGQIGVAITNVLMNPFTSLTGMGFAKEIAKESKKLFEEHPEEFENLKKGWEETNKALESLSDTLDSIDDQEMQEIEDGLESVLRDYESAYDGAKGADNTSASELRKAAAGTTTR